MVSTFTYNETLTDLNRLRSYFISFPALASCPNISNPYLDGWGTVRRKALEIVSCKNSKTPKRFIELARRVVREAIPLVEGPTRRLSLKETRLLIRHKRYPRKSGTLRGCTLLPTRKGAKLHNDVIDTMRATNSLLDTLYQVDSLSESIHPVILKFLKKLTRSEAAAPCNGVKAKIYYVLRKRFHCRVPKRNYKKTTDDSSNRKKKIKLSMQRHHDVSVHRLRSQGTERAEVDAKADSIPTQKKILPMEDSYEEGTSSDDIDNWIDKPGYNESLDFMF